jgi:hypothetical protein
VLSTSSIRVIPLVGGVDLCVVRKHNQQNVGGSHKTTYVCQEDLTTYVCRKGVPNIMLVILPNHE